MPYLLLSYYVFLYRQFGLLGIIHVPEILLIVNKATNKLAYIERWKDSKGFSSSSRKTNELTPEGTFDVVMKAKDPYYIAKDIAGGSPKNPLGSRWIGFNARGTDGSKYGIHGTNQPSSIGKLYFTRVYKNRRTMWNLRLHRIPNWNESLDCEIGKNHFSNWQKKKERACEKANEKVGFFYYNKLS